MKLRKVWIAESTADGIYSICMRIPTNEYIKQIGTNDFIRTVYIDDMEVWIDSKNPALGKETNLRLGLLDYDSLVELYEALDKFLREN